MFYLLEIHTGLLNWFERGGDEWRRNDEKWQMSHKQQAKLVSQRFIHIEPEPEQ